MATFEQSENVATNKIFLVQRSELTERFDPDMVLYSREVKSFSFAPVKLKSLLKKQPQYGANESGIERIDKNEPRYIRITDINEDGLLNENAAATAERIEDKYILNDNDILFARSGATVGKAYLHKEAYVNYKCFFAGYMIRFVVDENKMLPSYLFAYTRLSPYKKWIKAVQRASGQPNINAEEYKSLLIPLPQINVQREIVKILDEGYFKKQKKEIEAQKLLESIDAYLLNRLGINVTEIDSNKSKNRSFEKSLSELSGNRLDPLFYISNITLFRDGRYETKPLKQLILSLKSGIGAGKEDQAQDDRGIIQIRPTNINTRGELIFDKNVYLPYGIEIDKLEDGDVLFNNTNSQEWVGKSALFNGADELAYSNHITVIKVKKDELIPEYLWLILNSYQKHKIFYSICTNWNNQSGVGNELLKSLSIPVPPPEKQKEIAKHVRKIKDKAKHLLAEAQNIIEEARRTIEKMIIN